MRKESDAVLPTEEEIYALRDALIGLHVINLNKQHQINPTRVAYHPIITSQSFYDLTLQITSVWQKLICIASTDQKLIENTFAKTAQTDPLINRLLQLYKLHPKSNQSSQFLLSRCDYIMNREGIPKLVEFSTMPGGAFKSQDVNEAKRLSDVQNRMRYTSQMVNKVRIKEMLEDVFFSRGRAEGAALIIVQFTRVELSQFEVEIMRKGIRVLRSTLVKAANHLHIEEGKLYYDEHMVHFVNLMSGISWQEYLYGLEESWKTRRVIAQSDAVVFPSLSMELVGHKRMQIELYKPHVYQQYLTPQQASLLQISLVKTSDFDSMSQEQLNNLIVECEGKEDGYILKPNAEGGGHNLYGQMMIEQLKSLSLAELSSFILMEKIQTNSFENVLVCGPEVTKHECEAQFSHFGVQKLQEGRLVRNEVTGRFVRIKDKGSNEVGVISMGGAYGVWITD